MKLKTLHKRGTQKKRINKKALKTPPPVDSVNKLARDHTNTQTLTKVRIGKNVGEKHRNRENNTNRDLNIIMKAGTQTKALQNREQDSSTNLESVRIDINTDLDTQPGNVSNKTNRNTKIAENSDSELEIKLYDRIRNITKAAKHLKHSDINSESVRKDTDTKLDNFDLETLHKHAAETCNKNLQDDKRINTQFVKRLETRYTDSIAINKTKILGNKGQNSNLEIPHEHAKTCNKNTEGVGPNTDINQAAVQGDTSNKNTQGAGQNLNANVKSQIKHADTHNRVGRDTTSVKGKPNLGRPMSRYQGTRAASIAINEHAETCNKNAEGVGPNTDTSQAAVYK